MRQLRWGLIGCGDISRKRVAPALRDLPNCDFVGVSRAKAALAEDFAREFGARKWYSDWRDLVADPEIEAVYVATPVYLHAEQTIAAAEHGKHVLCEKPMAMNVAECDRMIEACRANGVLLGVAYYRHFYPVVQRIKQILAAGELGKPVIVQINAFEQFNPTPDHPRYWLVVPEKAGGGPMFDFGCHRIEVMLNLLGPVESVRAVHSKALYDRQVEDTSAAVFRFRNGACGVLTVTHAAQEPQDTLDVFCSHGSIHVPVLNRGQMIIRRAEAETTEEHPPHPNFHLPLIDDFTRAVTEGRTPGVPGETGREVNLIEELIYAGEISPGELDP